MTEFVSGLAVVVALGVALLAAHQLWLARVRPAEPELFAEDAVPAPFTLHAVESVHDEQSDREPLAS